MSLLTLFPASRRLTPRFPDLPAKSHLDVFTLTAPLPVTLSHTASLRVSPTSASPSWTPGPGLQDMSRRPAPGVLESGWREGGVGSGDAPSPEPKPSARSQPLDSVGGAGRELGRSGERGGAPRRGCPSPGPGTGHLGGVNEPQARICVTGNTNPLRLLGSDT